MSRPAHLRRRPASLRFMACSILLLGATAACDEDLAGPENTAPGVVLLIGDGMGRGALDAARITFGDLALETLPERAQVRTNSVSEGATDSGAAATAYACGVATHNGGIGVDQFDVPKETVLEAAEARGWATALVATSPITDATPAAFAAHVPNRGEMNTIALDMADSGVDVLLGGGLRYFAPGGRPDGQNVLAGLSERGCEIRAGPSELTMAAGSAACIVGLFSESGLPPARRRAYSLADMARLALDVVTRDPDGFFIMIEGSQIDWAASENDGPGLLDEMADFDGAVRAVLDALGSRPNTLIIVTADHETGGLTAEEGAAGEAILRWSTPNHTTANVPLFGTGPGLETISGEVDNEEVGAFLLRFVRGTPEG